MCCYGNAAYVQSDCGSVTMYEHTDCGDIAMYVNNVELTNSTNAVYAHAHGTRPQPPTNSTDCGDIAIYVNNDVNGNSRAHLSSS